METGLFPPVLIAWAQVQADILGHKQCRKVGVGAVIRKLREGLPENGVGSMIAERRGAALLLESHCRLCGRCREMRG